MPHQYKLRLIMSYTYRTSKMFTPFPGYKNLIPKYYNVCMTILNMG